MPPESEQIKELQSQNGILRKEHGQMKAALSDLFVAAYAIYPIAKQTGHLTEMSKQSLEKAFAIAADKLINC